MRFVVGGVDVACEDVVVEDVVEFVSPGMYFQSDLLTIGLK